MYYHFVSANKRLRYDLKDIEVSVGMKLAFEGEPILCEQGLHASVRALDALRYAPPDAQWLCGVTLSGTVVHGEGKSAATERTIVWILNVRKLLVEFALWNAEQAFAAIRAIGLQPDERSIEAVRVVRLWLVDGVSEDELSAAADAADAAYAAARAAYAAARAAARAADVAYAAQNEQLEKMINAALAEQHRMHDDLTLDDFNRTADTLAGEPLK